MSNPNRDRLYFDPTVKNVQEKRRLVKPPKTVTPWYSLNNNRNVVIIAVLMTSALFIGPIYDFGKSISNAFRMQRIKNAYHKELDEEIEREGTLKRED